ncbi:hypothetical protein AVEN_223077-1 [Araneus ventricosus]|uniref:Apple domain-containing protein n=3 Tax=Araneus ventricosus TaxID=182803 RepID=A0A4Y1ZJJ6_ARAVE|nr:hypothetical protein AVEN_41373-1 [Araneus ventricosus]GBL53207.1 hypothetical protein AVEN_223077-1 [Araneus ventricosus]
MSASNFLTDSNCGKGNLQLIPSAIALLLHRVCLFLAINDVSMLKKIVSLMSVFHFLTDSNCENSFLHKIRGLLRVYDDEVHEKGDVKGGLQECQRLCTEDENCRAIGYAEHVSQLDLETGLYLRKERQ